MFTKPTIEVRQAHPYAAVRMQVPIPFGKFLAKAYSRVQNWLAEKEISNGPAIIRYLTTDMSQKLDIEVGFTIDQAIAGDQNIITGILPAGSYATLLHTGSYKGKGVYKANVALLEWAQENGISWQTTTIDGVEWWGSRVEWYLTDPEKEADPKKYQTELTFLIAEKK
jgi:effector-binding domain-containing protein